MKYTFKRYYKYCFLVEDENGQNYINNPEDAIDISRFEITADGMIEEIAGKYFINGVEFGKI